MQAYLSPKQYVYDLGNWSLIFASVSGQMAPAFSLSNYFGLDLLLLLKPR